MKNIHVLPTDKPTWLHKSLLTNILRKSSSCINNMRQAQGMNIYITNDEEIKEGDYYIDFTSNGIKIEHFKTKDDWVLVGICDSKKIILTTDQDLIADGVQAIDDEFLEWFVKNPSCEWVEVYKDERLEFEQDFDFYEIIIPKEEPKQDRTCANNCSVVCGECQIFEPKQETLEEVALNYAKKPLLVTTKDGFIAGAKWQQQQNKNLYSEDEVLEQLNLLYSMKNSLVDTFTDKNDRITMKWFEQFKKK